MKTYHVLIRDDHLGQYRRIVPEDRPRLVPDPTGRLYRVVRDVLPEVCFIDRDGWRLCDFPVPHDHPLVPVRGGDPEEMARAKVVAGLMR